MSDETLIQACLQGNPSAQQKLFERFAPKLMGVCSRYAMNDAEAEDMLQEGMIKVFQKLKSYKNEGSFEGWIRRTVVNTCLDILRKEKKTRNHMDVDEAVNIESDSQSAMDKLNTEVLLKLVQNLPPGYRAVFNMYAIEGYSHKEIAEIMGYTESTSKSQFRKARLALISEIEKIEIHPHER